jgi:hypothetical protein
MSIYPAGVISWEVGKKSGIEQLAANGFRFVPEPFAETDQEVYVIPPRRAGRGDQTL